MGRIFKIDVEYLNHDHKIIVSVANSKPEPFIHIHLTESVFQRIFHAEHIRYKGFYGYKELELFKVPLLGSFIQFLGMEIHKELQGKYAIVKKIFTNNR